MVGHAVGTVVAFVVSRWRRSLQTRVAVTTLVVSGTVVLLLGVILMEQVSNGLLDARTRSATGELEFGLSKVSSQFAAADRTDAAAVDSTVDAVINDLANRGGPTELYDVALLTSAPGLSGRVTGDVDESSIPASVRSAVDKQGREAWAYTTIRYRDGRTESGLVAGAPVHAPGVAYELYYLFPLRQERATISLVQRTALFTGGLLVLLLVAIAALVTRQVVRPVRAAAATAERLASGRLEERMSVHGEDEIARLATSFNDMAARLQGHITRLEELSRVQRRFVADVSHELRTPLATIRMAADLLHESREQFDPNVARSAELLHAQLDRFELLLADLLEMSRHDAGVVVLEAEPVDLRALVERLVADAEPLATRRGSQIRVTLPDAPVVAEIDPRRVTRILRNLVSNAIEHGEGKPIDVALASGRSSVAVCVSDQGIGLRPGEAERVFDRFWRADRARSRATGGTGLGLSIALQDTRLHGGWLEVVGDAGRGAVFRLTLPRRSGEELTESPLPLQTPRRKKAAAAVPTDSS